MYSMKTYKEYRLAFHFLSVFLRLLLLLLYNFINLCIHTKNEFQYKIYGMCVNKFSLHMRDKYFCLNFLYDNILLIENICFSSKRMKRISG